MSKTKCLIHIVFATKRRHPSVNEDAKRKLYAYIQTTVENNRCYLHKVGGAPDHIHMLIDQHPTMSLSVFMRDLKQWSSKWMKECPDFPYFDGWSEGYYAVSVGPDGLETCKRYIANQTEHHGIRTLDDELQILAKAYGMDWYPDDLK